MRILVDENIPRMTVQALIDLGHEVRDVRGTPDQAVPDEELWRIAQREQRLLITTDKGFATPPGPCRHSDSAPEATEPHEDPRPRSPRVAAD